MHRKPTHRLTAMIAAIVTLVFTVVFSIPAAAAGSPWQTVPGATLPANTYLEILGVTMITPNDVWTVGDVQGAAGKRPLAEHWNGTQWSVVPTPNPTGNTFKSVAIVGPNDVWAVGVHTSVDSSGIHHYATLTEQWNGTQWNHVSSPSPIPDDFDGLTGVAAVPSGTLWAITDQEVFLRNTTG